jgi:transcriptional regulator with XRE-family HTH domain
MQLTIGEKIKIIMGRQSMTISQLAEKTGQSRQNMSNKMSRDNFTEQEAKEIAAALGAEFVGTFRFEDGAEI